MPFFIEHREKINLVPYQLHEKEQYFSDLSNIEGSWTGRIDAQIANTFIHEAVQLIVNSISVYEMGYFDCAYYSLRQSIEISTSMVYLMELETEKREEELKKWKAQSTFPMFNQMIKFLNTNGNVFADMRNQMVSYFVELQSVKEHLNKIVHKLGFNTFYVSRNHALNQNKDKTRFHSEFTKLTEKSIGAIAVLRLAIDPFPVLLMDEEIYTRTGDMLTEPYSQVFVERYIGLDNIEAYKHTEFYSSHYQSFMKNKKMLPSVIDVVKNQYIDREMFEEILTQVDLLGYIDFLVVFCFQLSDKISVIYSYDGLKIHFSNIKSNRSKFGFSSLTFKKIKESDNHFNNTYEEAFLSYVNANGEDLFLEHNEPFSEDEFDYIAKVLKDLATYPEKEN
ncbi:MULTISPECIES: hypothetical protein [Paenibacillus]|uniref:hypothetical protein n=1 Tax=Paenibacillus TaxID=44249 RepID=UPI00096EAD2A|nr:hypothetical protein [Paenibacillus odorifer]OMD81165.1 hypothetical protein BSK53_19300 [Paenibacillus odorifer]